jgi:hypothetical protein
MVVQITVAMKKLVYALIIIAQRDITIQECVIKPVEINVEEKENVIYSQVNALFAMIINGEIIAIKNAQQIAKWMEELIVAMLKILKIIKKGLMLKL